MLIAPWMTFRSMLEILKKKMYTQYTRDYLQRCKKDYDN